MLLRLVEPTAGEVLFEGQPLPPASSAADACPAPPHADRLPGPLRRAQSAHDASARSSPSRSPSTASRRPKACRARLRELLRSVGLDESALPRYPHEFSGGQRQRINIARALALRPQLPRARRAGQRARCLGRRTGHQPAARSAAKLGLTYLFISHSMPLVRYLCDRVAVMQRGRLVESATACRCASTRTTPTRASSSQQRRRCRSPHRPLAPAELVTIEEDDFQPKFALFLPLAGRGLLHRGRDQRDGRRRLLHLLSRDARHRRPAHPGQRHQHGRAVAGPAYVGLGPAHRPAPRPARRRLLPRPSSAESAARSSCCIRRRSPSCTWSRGCCCRPRCCSGSAGRSRAGCAAAPTSRTSRALRPMLPLFFVIIPVTLLHRLLRRRRGLSADERAGALRHRRDERAELAEGAGRLHSPTSAPW